MGTAKEAGGLYYVGGVAVNANGEPIDGGPPKPEDTVPDQQPGSLNAPSLEERIAGAVATALKPGVTAIRPVGASTADTGSGSVTAAGGARKAARKSGSKK